MPHFRDVVSRLTLPVEMYHGSGFGSGFFRTMLGAMALQDGRTAHFHGIEGFPNADLNQIWEEIGKLVPGLRAVTQEHPYIQKSYVNMASYAYDSEDDCRGDSFRIWDEGFIHFNTFNDGSLKINVGSLNEDIMHEIVKAADPFLAGDMGRASISVISNSAHGPMLRDVGDGGTPIIRGNYQADALAVFDHVVKDIASPNPCGRLCIFTGPPGCGKTYFLEGIFAAQKNCRYIVLPPEVIRNVAAPELLRVLLPDDSDGPGRSRNGSHEGPSRIPTVLVIEDADEVLTNRQLDNLPAISAILNLTDGILGRALDIRVLATSNIKIKDVDKALVRDGRRCRNYDFQPLSADHANAVYRREYYKAKGWVEGERDDLEGTTYRTFDRMTSLAEVYRAVKEDA